MRRDRLPAIVTFVTTARASAYGIGAAFWGLLLTGC
jgi:predicted benzoate:H+ symporter BenE